MRFARFSFRFDSSFSRRSNIRTVPSVCYSCPKIRRPGVGQCRRNVRSFDHFVLRRFRTHSDSSLHTAMIPQVVANYHATFDRFPLDQPLNYEENHQPKFDFPNYQMAPTTASQYALPTNHFQPSYYQYDLNNNNSYANGQIHSTYSFASAPTTPLPPTMAGGANTAVVPTQLPAQQHTLLAGRFSGGNPTSNVLMLPPNQHARANGGSLPDLRTGNPYQSTSTMSFTSMPSPSTAENARFRSTSPHPNGDVDLLSLVNEQTRRRATETNKSLSLLFRDLNNNFHRAAAQ